MWLTFRDTGPGHVQKCDQAGAYAPVNLQVWVQLPERPRRKTLRHVVFFCYDHTGFLLIWSYLLAFIHALEKRDNAKHAYADLVVGRGVVAGHAVKCDT